MPSTVVQLILVMAPPGQNFCFSAAVHVSTSLSLLVGLSRLIQEDHRDTHCGAGVGVVDGPGVGVVGAGVGVTLAEDNVRIVKIFML